MNVCVAGLVEDPSQILAALPRLRAGGFALSDCCLFALDHAIQTQLAAAYLPAGPDARPDAVGAPVFVPRDDIRHMVAETFGALFLVAPTCARGRLVGSAGRPLSTIASWPPYREGSHNDDHPLAAFCGHRHGGEIAEHLRDDGFLLWVEANGIERQEAAVTALLRAGARNAHLHSFAFASSVLH